MQEHRLPPKKYRKLPGVLLTSAAQRKACWERDKGICAKCGVDNGKKYQADHVLALHAIPPSCAWPERAKYWRIENLQTMGMLCGCAQTKTAIEATSRAKVKRIVKKAETPRKPRPHIPFRPFCPVPKQKLTNIKKFVSKRPPVVSYLGLK